MKKEIELNRLQILLGIMMSVMTDEQLQEIKRRIRLIDIEDEN